VHSMFLSQYNIRVFGAQSRGYRNHGYAMWLWKRIEITSLFIFSKKCRNVRVDLAKIIGRLKEMFGMSAVVRRTKKTTVNIRGIWKYYTFRRISVGWNFRHDKNSLNPYPPAHTRVCIVMSVRGIDNNNVEKSCAYLQTYRMVSLSEII